MSISANPITDDAITKDSVTPYQVITLLLDGALDRIDKAISSVSEGDIDEAAILVQKTMGIVGGLRESLDLTQGGDIANNLDALYEYILVRLEGIGADDSITTLSEVKKLLQEVHSGWVGISASVE